MLHRKLIPSKDIEHTKFCEVTIVTNSNNNLEKKKIPLPTWISIIKINILIIYIN